MDSQNTTIPNKLKMHLTVTGVILTATGIPLASAEYAPDLLYVLIPALAAVSALLLSRYQFLKKKISGLREAIIILDNAVQDDRITEEEFRQIYESFRKLLAKT
ncbi:MAG: hypothetical protein SCH70_07835 [Candidatus Methanoperedens sp.]|nr:hypothetical protein [Candidatus Methanoperedens sp.]